MSHISNISTNGIEFDLGVLKALCQQEGWAFIDNQKTYRWFGRFVGDSPMPAGFTEKDLGKCDHAISIPGCSYELGVLKGKNGGYIMLADFWMEGGLHRKFGAKGEKFIQYYGVAQDKVWAESKGYDWEEVEAPEGARKIAVYVNDNSWDGGGEW